MARIRMRIQIRTRFINELSVQSAYRVYRHCIFFGLAHVRPKRTTVPPLYDQRVQHALSLSVLALLVSN